jgi:hypothetical protein
LPDVFKHGALGKAPAGLEQSGSGGWAEGTEPAPFARSGGDVIEAGRSCLPASRRPDAQACARRYEAIALTELESRRASFAPEVADNRSETIGRVCSAN